MLRCLRLAFRSSQSIQAENLFLRRQLALYIERGVKPRRIDAATRIALTVLSRLFDWRDALAVVSPATLIRWHRAGWRLFWRMRSRPGRPPIPPELQALIRPIANENPSWGEERIANELLLKLGIRVSPRTVNEYLPRRPRGRPRGDLRWSTFLRLHAHRTAVRVRQHRSGLRLQSGKTLRGHRAELVKETADLIGLHRSDLHQLRPHAVQRQHGLLFLRITRGARVLVNAKLMQMSGSGPPIPG
jgi:Homeodomain-like domain